MLSSNVVLCCRDIISVSLGCLKVPGDDAGVVGRVRGVEGVDAGVTGLWPDLDDATRARVCKGFETRAVDVADMMWVKQRDCPLDQYVVREGGGHLHD